MKTAFRISLDGAQAAPNVTTSASGFGYAVFDDIANTLSYSITVTGLDFGTALDGGSPETSGTDDDATAAHFHIADRGASGGAAFNLFSQDADDFAQIHNPDGSRTISGTWETTDPATNPITDYLATLTGATLGGDIGIYVNIHTSGNPGGELRGQLVAMADDTANQITSTVTGTAGRDHLLGLDGNDQLLGLAGADVLDGGLGQDTLYGGLGQDTLFGGEGADVLNAGEEFGFASDPTLSDELYGGDGNDTLNGNGSNSKLFGGAGDDDLSGGGLDGLNDTLDGGTGADTMVGQGGSDLYFVDNIGDSVAEYTYDSYGPDNTATGDVDEIRSTIDWTLDQWNDDGFNVENLTLLDTNSRGEVGEDTSDDLPTDINATGNEVANVIKGNSGNNRLDGAEGADTIIGGAGVDTLIGGTGDDEMSGGAGIDTAVFTGNYADATLSAAAGYTAIVTTATGGQDTLTEVELLQFDDQIVDLRTLDYGATVVTSGDRRKGETLYVGTSDATTFSWDTVDIDTMAFRWTRDGTPIAGATGDSYTLTQADVGTDIQGVISFTNVYGFADSVSSAPSTPIEETTNSDPTGAVTISGTATQGETLTAETSTVADADGLGTFSYQWLQASGSDAPSAIAGATSETYTLVQSDVGKAISARVAYTDNGGTAESVTSAATSAIANINDDPTGAVTISGTPTQGETLTADASAVADADGLGTFSYQWLSDGSTIAGATSETYTLGQSDVGKAISARVAYTDGGGNPESLSSAASAAIANVNDDPTGAVTISGTPGLGGTLTADASPVSDADGLGDFSYQWMRNGEAIAGATESTHRIGFADFGKDISVALSYTDNGGFAEVITSEATAVSSESYPDILVTTTDDVIDADDGVTSLREAVILANEDSDANTIRLSAETYHLGDPANPTNGSNAAIAHSEANAASGDLDLQGEITLLGDPAGGTIISNHMGTRALQVHDGAQVQFTGLTISAPEVLYVQDGGAVLNSGGNLSIHQVDFSNNLMASSRVVSHSSDKKGYETNYEPSQGGAIFNQSGSLDISASAFQGNKASLGGAIHAAGGDVTVESTSFDNNSVYSNWVDYGGDSKYQISPITIEKDGQGSAIYSAAGAQVNIFDQPSGGLAGPTTLTNNTGGTSLIIGNVYLEDSIEVSGQGNTPDTLTAGVTRDAPLSRVAAMASAMMVAAMTSGEAALTMLEGSDLTAEDLLDAAYQLAENPFVSAGDGEIVLQLGDARLVIGGTGLVLPDDLESLTLTELLEATSGTVTSLALTNVDGTEVLATLTGFSKSLQDMITLSADELDPDALPSIDIITDTPVTTTVSDTPLELPASGLTLTGTEDADVLLGEGGNDTITGLDGNDRLVGNGGDDSLAGGDGADTLNGGVGDDFIFGGETEADLRDVIYGGAGDDSIDAGYGNDLVYGQDGNDTIAGGFGVDELQGQGGNDVITGSAYSDLIFGGAGNDFVNGGFGHDRVNGGAGADKFYHLGIADHGSDWIQDYNAAEGDVLLFGNASATVDDFQVNFTNTDGAGDASVSEAFVIYKPTEQIMWALVDGAGQDQINLKIGGSSDEFDLLA